MFVLFGARGVFVGPKKTHLGVRLGWALGFGLYGLCGSLLVIEKAASSEALLRLPFV